MAEIKRILIDSRGKRFFVRDINADYHCQHGFVKSSDLKKRAGSVVRTNKGVELVLLNPLFADKLAKIKRGPQIIPLKDIGAIISETGIGRDWLCVDAGAGSGYLSFFLANIAKKVVSYEVREDFLLIAKENASLLGIKNITFKNKDVREGIDERGVDLVTLDLPDPWSVAPHAEKALKKGGFLVSYSPTVPQVSDFVSSLKATSLARLKTVEVMQREWEVEGRKVRPKSQPIGHSGFITICRKL